MISQSKLACALIALLLASAGCLTIPVPDEENRWSIDMGGHDEQIGEEYRFTGDVALGGNYGDVTAEGVYLEFLDEENKTIETIHVGTLNASRSLVEINITVERRPKYVLVFVREVNAPQSNNKESWISGLERVESGDYYRYTDYDPYALANETKN